MSRETQAILGTVRTASIHTGRLAAHARMWLQPAGLTFVSWAIFLLIFRCRSWVYSIAMPGWKVTVLVAEDELNFP